MRCLNKSAALIISAVINLTCHEAVFSQQVTRHSDSSESLASRFEWAKHEASNRSLSDGYWTGYCIRKLMSESSFIGTYHSNSGENKPTLRELISGSRKGEAGLPGISDREGDFEGTFSFENEGESRPMVVKEVAILFHFRGPSDEEVDRVAVSNLSLHVKLSKADLIWLGVGNNEESIGLIRSIYGRASSEEVKKKMIMAAGIHDPGESIFEFFKKILLSSEKTPVREEAAFWTGQCNMSQALGLLEQISKTDQSEELCKKAVFAISEMNGDSATESLIRLARGSGNDEVRKEATFWLGQRASRKAVSALKDMVVDADNTEVQKSALFALSQLPDDEGLLSLIKIAETHSNPEIRKQAIFWLSQCEDPRALEAITKIVRK